MEANKIIIGDTASPLFIFENDKIISIEETASVSLIGDELSIDQLIPVCSYELFLRYVFKPRNYDSFITADGLTLCGHNNYDIRKLPYGTAVTFMADNAVRGIYYVDFVDRTGSDEFKLTCVSAVGLMDKQPHCGGIYTGQSFTYVLADILGDQYSYEIADEVASLQVFGWLPYATRRQNLHQLISAYGVNIVHADNGNMLFTFLTDSEPANIVKDRIYAEGSVSYNSPASRIEITEHSYHYLPGVEEKQLFDNTSGEAVNNVTVTFDEPIYPASLSATGSLSIISSGVNHAVVSGMGILTGKPYVHNTKILARDNPDATDEKVVSIDSATLITIQNSENAMSRLSNYYFNATVIHGNLVLGNEKCGRRYAMYNAFGDYLIGFMSKMAVNSSGIAKADCEVISDYVPTGQGAAFSHVQILSDAGGVWTIPQEVFQKPDPKIKVICIGKGFTGGNGEAGASGAENTVTSGGAGGTGGNGGSAGQGGLVYSMTIDCTGLSQCTYSITPSNSIFTAGSTVLNSALGATPENGFLEIFTGTVYCLPGVSGQKGADGGNGGYFTHTTAGRSAEAGGDTTYDTVTYRGGAARNNIKVNGTEWEMHVNLDVYCSSGGGGGSAVGADGNPGTALGRFGIDAGMVPGEGGDGANGANASPAQSTYGSGGNGGHGGGGGGGGGMTEYWNYVYSALIAQSINPGGVGGTGGLGSEGAPGCIIIYW